MTEFTKKRVFSEESNSSSGGTIAGSGTLKFIPKFTPDGITLGNSQLKDNSTTYPLFNLLTSTAVDYCTIKLDSATNIFFGFNSGIANLPGSGAIDNTAFGYSTLASNTTGSLCTAFGKRALEANTIGTNNTAIGPGALLSNIIGSECTAIGLHALMSSLANNNLAIGNYAAMGITSGASILAIGKGAYQGATTANASIAIGLECMIQNNGDENIGMGVQVLYANVVGIKNTVIGASAGYSNLGSRNVFLGYNAGYNETGSDKLYIANSNTATPLIGGDFSAGTLAFRGKVGINKIATTTSPLSIGSIPTSSVGLVSGDVWSNAGILTIV